MKHLLEHDTGIYLTNNEFKDAMLLAGYQPVNPNSLNWKHRIKLMREMNNNPCPFFHWAGKCEKDAIPCGDFVRDMLRDFECPVLAEHGILVRYLRHVDACSGAVEAFEELWRDLREKQNFEGKDTNKIKSKKPQAGSSVIVKAKKY